LDYAVDFVDEHGEAALRIADIERATGAAASSIYHFFVNREGLIAAAEVERYKRSFDSFAERIGPVVESISTFEEYRSFILQVHREATQSEHAITRLRRIAVIGSGVGRPDLMEQIALIEDDVIVRTAALLRVPQERGWIRPNVDLCSLAAWTIGLYLSRSLIELGMTSAKGEEWDRMAEIAVLAVMFGDGDSRPGPSDD
jgi:AcrR family transcriptional regulator